MSTTLSLNTGNLFGKRKSGMDLNMLNYSAISAGLETTYWQVPDTTVDMTFSFGYNEPIPTAYRRRSPRNKRRKLAKSSDPFVFEEELKRDVAVWDWDCFKAKEMSMLVFLLSKLKKLNEFYFSSVDFDCVFTLLENISHSYKDEGKVPFHCFRHAFSVTQHLLYIIYTNFYSLGFYTLKFSTLLALTVAAVGHDVQHPGLSNITNLVKKYGTLEAYHFICLRKMIIKHNPFNIFGKSEQKKIWVLIESVILDTNMSRHAEVANTLFKFVTFRKTRKTDIKNVCGSLLHICDLSGQTMPLKMAIQWEKRISEECNSMKSLSLAQRSKSQALFIDKLVLPSWEHLDKISSTQHQFVTRLKQASEYFSKG